MLWTIDNAYLVWLAALSVAAFVTFGWDKLCAVRNRPRVSERTLLLLILLGGPVGGWLGRICFRHKTRKPLFGLALLVGAALHGVLLWLRFRGAGI